MKVASFRTWKNSILELPILHLKGEVFVRNGAGTSFCKVSSDLVMTDTFGVVGLLRVDCGSVCRLKVTLYISCFRKYLGCGRILERCSWNLILTI